jgi:hypothetical protein
MEVLYKLELKNGKSFLEKEISGPTLCSVVKQALGMKNEFLFQNKISYGEPVTVIDKYIRSAKDKFYQIS